MLALAFDATDTHRIRELAYLLLLVAGAALLVGVPLLGRRFGGLALAAAGVLLFAAERWGA